jgi:hypothetical protein
MTHVRIDPLIYAIPGHFSTTKIRIIFFITQYESRSFGGLFTSFITTTNFKILKLASMSKVQTTGSVGLLLRSANNVRHQTVK